VVARRPPDVVSLMMMPRLDGFALCGLASAPHTQTLPVILLGPRGGESRVEGLDAGADDYLIKPFARASW
jgi:DNA-binding response OmpR family regulator